MSVTPKTKLIIITGVPGAGKTTAARALAERLQPATRVSTDCIRRKVYPHTKPWQKPDGIEQMRLGIAATAAVARVYLEAGFGVVIDDVVGTEARQQYQPLLDEFNGITVLLKPKLEVAQQRYVERGISLSAQHRTEELYTSLDAEDFDLTIDNSEFTPDQTVKEIEKGIGQ